MPVGLRSITSFAKEGPDKKAMGCLRPSALGMTSLIILPVPTSKPLLTEAIGTSYGRTSYQCVGRPDLNFRQGTNFMYMAASCTLGNAKVTCAIPWARMIKLIRVPKPTRQVLCIL